MLATLRHCRASLHAHALAAACALVPALACAQADYPSKPIRMIQGVSASSSSGLLGRMISDWLARDLKQTIVVENMSGAGGTLGMQTAAKSKPDGYTLVMLTQAQAISESLYSKLGYRLLDDFQPISQVATGYYLLTVHPGVQANSVKELIALAKAKPGALNYASSGNGTGTHLAAALFNSRAGVDIVHVPFKGTAEGLAPFMNGSVQLYFLGLPSLQPLLKAGKARALAVTSAKRQSDLPNIPTVAETLPGFEMTLWQGVATVAGTPAPIVGRLHASILRVMGTPEAKTQLEQQGTDVETNTPEVFKAYIRSQVAIFAEAIKASGAKVE